MRSICFFSSYSAGGPISRYVKFYLDELIKHFTEVIFITNEREIAGADKSFLEGKHIQLMLVKNEGFDFGMWYKAFQKYNVDVYDRVGLINDSCIMFSKLDDFFKWADKEPADYCGYTDCELITYHVQSYFILVNKNAIPLVKKYFETNGIISDFMNVIKVYEVGLSTYLINANMKLSACFSFKGMYGIGNPSWMRAKELIAKGYPLVKKRIIARNYGPTKYWGLIAAGFDPYPSHYIRLIKRTNKPNYEPSIFDGIQIGRGIGGEMKFQIICIVARLYGFLGRRKRASGLMLRKMGLLKPS